MALTKIKSTGIDTSNLNLTVSSITANGSLGSAGQVLSTNGTAVYWDTAAGGGVSAGGSDTQIQFNDGGSSLNATAGFTFDKVTNTVAIGNTLTVGISLVSNSIGFTVAGFANVSGAVNASSLVVGSSFIANTTGAYHTGVVNASSVTANTMGVTSAITVSSSVVANSTGITVDGFANVSGSINSASFSVGSNFAANATYVGITSPLTANGGTGTSGQLLTSNGTTGSPYWSTISLTPGATYVQNTDSRTLSGNLIISGTYFNPASNTTLLGNATSRWAINANTGNFSGDVVVTGNLTVSGTTTTVNTVNLSVDDNMIYLNANSDVANPDLGFAGNYNDGTYHHAGFFRDASDGYWKVFDNYAPEPDASAFIDTSNTTFRIANLQANGILASVLDAYTSVNSAVLSVGSSFIANATGVYHTGIVNAATLSVGSNFIANATQLTVTKPFSANGGTGTSGQVLTSNGSTGSPYWSTVSSSTATIDPFMLMGA